MVYLCKGSCLCQPSRWQFLMENARGTYTFIKEVYKLTWHLLQRRKCPSLHQSKISTALSPLTGLLSLSLSLSLSLPSYWRARSMTGSGRKPTLGRRGYEKSGGSEIRLARFEIWPDHPTGIPTLAQIWPDLAGG